MKIREAIQQEVQKEEIQILMKGILLDHQKGDKV